MSASGSQDDMTVPTQTPDSLVKAMTSKWEECSHRRKVMPMLVPDEITKPLRMLELPDWPGTGTLSTEADVFPLVSFEGMPASEYPRHIKTLTAYTLAELGTQSPHLAAAIWTPSLVRCALVTTSVRAGVWAAVGRAPIHSAPASASAVRWSASQGSLVVRPGRAGDGTGIWRYFLAMSPGLPSQSSEVAVALAGTGPSQFVMGSALLITSGEVYAMHYMEKALSSYLHATLSTAAVRYLRLDDRATWDTMTAAALGGFRASVARRISTDSAFILGANARVDPEGRRSILIRLEKILARSNAPGATFSSQTSGVARDIDVDIPDDVSVADTEVGLDSGWATPPDGSGAATPKPEMAPELPQAVKEELRDSIRKVPRMTDDAASMARMNFDMDSVNFGNF